MAETPEDKLKSILALPYEDFVKELGEFADDPKLLAAIKAGKKDGSKADDVVKFTLKDLHVSRLRPTQNEIDMTKSLNFPLENKVPEMTESILKGGPVTVKAPIIVLNNRYVIDGHHRWSQVYAMNPNAKISAYVMYIDDDPIDVLKAVHLAVASKTQEVPSQVVEGTNLYKAKRQQVIDYVLDNISDSTMEMMSSAGVAQTKDEAAEYIWSNIETMRRKSTPIKDAPNRGFMPQTDDAEDADGDWKKAMALGQINIHEPLVKNERRIYDFRTFINERLNEK